MVCLRLRPYSLLLNSSAIYFDTAFQPLRSSPPGLRRVRYLFGIILVVVVLLVVPVLVVGGHVGVVRDRELPHGEDRGPRPVPIAQVSSTRGPPIVRDDDVLARVLM